MALFDNYMAGGAKAPQTQQPYTTANNPYMQYGGRYYDWGDFDYRNATGGNPLRFMNGQFGYTTDSGFGSRPSKWVPLSRQPTQVDAPPTPGALQREKLTKEYQDALDEAKRQNEERYQQALQNLEGVGVQQTADVNTRFDSSRSAVNQNLVNAGLSGTTVLPSMQRGVERERQDALNRLAAMLAREKNQVILSRDDIPPDLQMYANLMYQTGSGGVR